MIEPVYRTERARLYHGRCEDVLPRIPSGSVDAVISDPIYPEIDRSYGRMSEADWHAMMDVVVPECRRVLKPHGSAVFVLQPNSERVGRMRTWLLRFILKWAEEWGWVQDAWWWNNSSMPSGGATSHGLLRGSLKACVWLGPSNCYRNQEAVLTEPSARTERRIKLAKKREDDGARVMPSGRMMNESRCATACLRRGGVIPYNVIATGNGCHDRAGSHGHAAGTPPKVCSWWTSYIVPPDNATVLDPFNGSGTVGKAALEHGASYVGIEKEAEYIQTSRRRLEAAERDLAEQLFP